MPNPPSFRGCCRRHGCRGLAEIDARGQFAHDQDIETRPPRRLSEENPPAHQNTVRAQVGEQVHFLAQAQQAARSGLTLKSRLSWGWNRRRRPAARASTDLRMRHRLIRRGLAVLVIGGAADQIRRRGGKAAVLFEPADLRTSAMTSGANAIAGQDQQGMGRHRRHPSHAFDCRNPPSLAVPLRQVHGELGCAGVADRAGWGSN